MEKEKVESGPKEAVVDGLSTLVDEITHAVGELYPALVDAVFRLEETCTLNIAIQVQVPDKDEPNKIKMFLKRSLTIKAPTWVVPGQVVDDGKGPQIMLF